MKKYIYILNDMRDKILKGVYPANAKIPPEKMLCEEYDVSKMTVKQALDILVNEGLIIKRRGSGSFVKDLSDTEIERISVSNQFRGKTATYPNNKVTSKILEFSVVTPSEQIQEKLNISDDSFVYHIKRVRYLDDKPNVIEETYMPIDLIPGLKKVNLENSIYEYIEDGLKLKIQSAHRKITMRKATSAEAEALAMTDGDPVAIAEQIGYLDTGTAFEFSISVHPYEEFSVEMVLSRD